MFNSELLIELIKKAQGDNSLNNFAKQCDISAGNLSKILNNKNKQAPKPDTLRKIAACSNNTVSYAQLLDAAGHIDIKIKSENNDESLLSLKDEKDIEKKIDALKDELLKNQDGLMLSGEPMSDEALESLFDTLAYGMRQAKIINKKYTPKKYRK